MNDEYKDKFLSKLGKKSNKIWINFVTPQMQVLFMKTNEIVKKKVGNSLK